MSNGYYFVTIVANQRQNLLQGNKTLIEKELKNLETDTVGLKIDYFVVMPNHIHVIFILEDCGIILGEIIRRFKARVSYRLKQKLWQPNYYEHVIRNEKALEKIREYIVNNPEAEILKFNQFYN